MSNDFYQDEFEQFLQDEVKQHRMYPSDHIWKNIRTELHGYKAWPALTFISLFIITALTISTVLNNHPEKHIVLPAAARVSPIADNIDAASGSPATHNFMRDIAPEQMTAETFAGMPETVPAAQPEALVLRNTANDNAATPVKSVYRNDRGETGSKSLATAHNNANASVVAQNITLDTVTADNTAAPAPASQDQSPAASDDDKKTETHGNADDFLKDFNFVAVAPQRHTSKFGFQFYVTPSTSYRRLSDAKVKEIIQPSVAASAAQNIPVTVGTGDVNNVVRHRPAVGFEIGFAVLYNMSDRLKFKTGLQLNVREYYIETYQSLTNDLASLSLINYRGVETISFYSPYNNNTGYRQTQLDNKVYQLSIPVGLQWDLVRGKRLGLNTEASVQPTFTLNNNTYLLSTDYKHYTTGNEFMRKWNINSSVGLNITYTTGSSSWQFGPQFRYQHLPTYSNLYPIKEHLMDYGVRIAYTRQIR